MFTKQVNSEKSSKTVSKDTSLRYFIVKKIKVTINYYKQMKTEMYETFKPNGCLQDVDLEEEEAIER